MKTPKVDTSGSEAASKAIADAQTAATNLQKNFSSDLATENLANVVSGGSAESAASTTATRRKKPTTGLSSQLGINV